jgi:hypothetical protein
VLHFRVDLHRDSALIALVRPQRREVADSKLRAWENARAKSAKLQKGEWSRS